MTNHKKMKQLPAEMRPYEKFRKLGAKKLSDEELLAIILRSGTKGSSSLALASEILTCSPTYPGLLGLHHLSLTQLQEIKGIGEVKAIQIKCIGELSRRIAKSASKSALRFQEPGTIADYYMEDMRHLEQETLVCMMLDTRNHLLGETELSRGTVNASLISSWCTITPAGIPCPARRISGLPDGSARQGRFLAFHCWITLSSVILLTAVCVRRG